MKMHRPSLSEIESGKRRVSVEELSGFVALYDLATGNLTGDQNAEIARDERACKKPAMVEESLALSAETVLVVEDQLLIRIGIAEHLRDCGYRVIEASNGDEAVEVLQADARIDLVFTDVQMPHRTGFELSQWLRRERPNVKIIFTSGGMRTAEIARNLHESAPVIDKPYLWENVVAQIRALLADDH